MGIRVVLNSYPSLQLSEINTIGKIFAFAEGKKVYTLVGTCCSGGCERINYAFHPPEAGSQTEFEDISIKGAIRQALEDGKNVFMFVDTNDFVEWFLGVQQ